MAGGRRTPGVARQSPQDTQINNQCTTCLQLERFYVRGQTEVCATSNATSQGRKCPNAARLSVIYHAPVPPAQNITIIGSIVHTCFENSRSVRVLTCFVVVLRKKVVVRLSGPALFLVSFVVRAVGSRGNGKLVGRSYACMYASVVFFARRQSVR